ncbi:RNA-binding protein [Salix suchowensis]|nr:RNA-binding protein [Salix suchowensis]
MEHSQTRLNRWHQEYVTLLVSNGRTKNQAKMLLGPFLGDANTALFVSWLWEFLSKKYMNPNASSDVENATGDGNATGKKQASKSSIIKPSDDSKKLSESVKCPDDDDLYSESSEEGELPRTHHQSIKEFEVSEIGYGESLKCASSRVEAYSGDLGVGGEESIPRKKVYTRSLRCKKLDVANVAGRRLFTRAAADAILHQRGRVHYVWDRLGKLPEGGRFANANMKGVEKIKEEVFECYGESTELNQSTHSLHDGRKFCGRLSEYFDIKTGASKDGRKRQFSDISSHQSGVSDSMDEEDAFIKKDRRLLPEEDSGVLSENCVSSGAGTPKSPKMGSASSSNASTSSKLKKMPEERLTREIFESPVTAVSYSTPVTGKLFCKDNSNVTANLKPVHKQLMDMKLRLEQLETEIVKLQSKKVEKKEQSSSKSGKRTSCKQSLSISHNHFLRLNSYYARNDFKQDVTFVCICYFYEQALGRQSIGIEWQIFLFPDHMGQKDRGAITEVQMRPSSYWKERMFHHHCSHLHNFSLQVYGLLERVQIMTVKKYVFVEVSSKFTNPNKGQKIQVASRADEQSKWTANVLWMPPRGTCQVKPPGTFLFELLHFLSYTEAPFTESVCLAQQLFC